MLVDNNTFNTRMAAVKAEIARCVSEGMRIFNLDLSKVIVSYNLTGSTAGYAQYRHGKYTVKLNRQFIAGTEESFQQLLTETISHEFAHIICFMNPRLGRQHDAGWKEVHRKMGGNGKRCHSVDVGAVKGGYDYLTSAGKVVTITSNRHNKIRRGRIYTFRKYGQISMASPVMVRRPGQPMHTKEDFLAKGFSVAAATPISRSLTAFGTGRELLKAMFNGQVIPSVPPVTNQVPAPTANTTPRTVSKPVLNNGMSKAEQVRGMIRTAKVLGESQSSVILRVIAVLEMTKAQASRYVTENWERA